MKAAQIENVSLFEFIIAIVVVLLLIFSIATMNLDKKGVIDEVNFEMAKQNFSQNTSLIRAQWLLEGRPKTLTFSFYVNQDIVSNNRQFELSKLGWPLVNSNEIKACRQVWLSVNNLTDADNIERYVRIKKIEKNNDIGCQFCDASDNDTCIEYSPRYGLKTLANELSN
jgi:hypothetical protein